MVEVAITPLHNREKFLADWNSLRPLAEPASFFQSSAWMSALLGTPPSNTDLFRVEAMENGATVLLGVIGYNNTRDPSVIGLTEARLHEFADPAHDAIYIEYNDFLVASGASKDLRRVCISAVLNHMSSADTIFFRNVTELLAGAIKGAATLPIRILGEQPVYVCDLRKPDIHNGDFISSLSKSLRANTRRAMRKYNTRGDLRFQIANTKTERQRAWDKMVDLHQKSWRARGKPGAFIHSPMVDFHHRLMKTTPASCHLFEVNAGADTIGVLYNFVYEDRIMNYQSGFHYEEDNQLTPGYVCHALAAQYYLDNGYATYDLLAGNADYKRRLGTQTTTLTSIAIDRPTWHNKAHSFMKKMRG